jgi:hypothetical protein
MNEFGGRCVDRRACVIAHSPLRRGIDSSRVIDGGRKELKWDASVRHERAARCEILVRQAMFAHKYVLV